MTDDPPITCRRCHEEFQHGDEYYNVPILGTYCPDCGEALFKSWLRIEGEDVDRI